MTVNEVVVAAMNRAVGLPPAYQAQTVESRPALRIAPREFEMLLERAETILKAREQAPER